MLFESETIQTCTQCGGEIPALECFRKNDAGYIICTCCYEDNHEYDESEDE